MTVQRQLCRPHFPITSVLQLHLPISGTLTSFFRQPAVRGTAAGTPVLAAGCAGFTATEDRNRTGRRCHPVADLFHGASKRCRNFHRTYRLLVISATVQLQLYRLSPKFRSLQQICRYPDVNDIFYRCMVLLPEQLLSSLLPEPGCVCWQNRNHNQCAGLGFARQQGLLISLTIPACGRWYFRHFVAFCGDRRLFGFNFIAATQDLGDFSFGPDVSTLISIAIILLHSPTPDAG